MDVWAGHAVPTSLLFSWSSAQKEPGTSLAVQWSELCVSTAGGTDLVPRPGSKILHASRCGWKNLFLIKKNEEPSQTWRSPTWRPSLLMPCTQSCLELRRGQSCLELRRGVGDLRNSSKQCLFTNIWASANSAAQGTFIVTQGTSWDSVLFATCLCLSASQPITSLVFKYFI